MKNALAPLATVLVALATAAPAGAQTTALFLDSQAGDHIGGGVQRTFTDSNATFLALYDVDGSVSVSVDGATSWNLDFSGNLAPLEVDQYENATKWPFTPFAGMNVFGDGRSCDTLTGRYWVREVEYGPSGAMTRLAVDFEQHCTDEAPGLFGALRFNSTITSLVPFDGLYPLYQLDITPPQGGVVTGQGINCDSGGASCSTTLSGAATITLTATPDSGHIFAGWTGYCHGGRTIATFVNMHEQCAATFRPVSGAGQSTLFYWHSQLGDYIGEGRREVYNLSNSLWTLEEPDSGALVLAIESVEDRSDSFWTLGFFAPAGSALTTGTYNNVTRFPTLANGGLDISGNGRGCAVVSGSFTVHELVVVSNVVTRLALDFEQHCEGIAAPPQPLRGSIRFNSEVPVRPSLAVTTTGAGAAIALSQPAVQCVGKCMATYDPGTQVQFTPQPAAGWALDSLTGDADCVDGAITMNAPVACQANFQPATIATSVTPASGSGSAQVFALQYAASGATSVTTPWVWFNPTFAGSAATSCLLRYDRSTGELFLLNDAGTVWQSATIASAGMLQNSQCVVDAGASSVNIAGATLTLNLSMQFRPAYTGAHNVFMFSGGSGGASSGWSDRGDWTVTAPPGPVVTAVSVTPSSGSGGTQSFAYVYEHNLGAAELATVWAWINTGLNSTAAGSCLAHYDQASALLMLLDDAGTTWMSGTLGGPGTLQNSQCAIALATSSATPSGNTLTLTLDTTLKPAFAGAKNVYLYAAGTSGAASGWQQRGTWTVPSGAITADSVTPNSGSGMSGTFAMQYSNSSGASGLSTVWVWFNATFASNAAGSCLLYYEPSTNTLRLINDAGTDWLAGTVGGAGTLQNSQCSVALGTSSATPSGAMLTLSLPMTFTTAFAGSKSIFMYAASTAGPASGWQTRGTWTVPGVTVTADSVTPSSGTGTTQTFAMQYTDSIGAANLSAVWVWFNGTFASSAAGSCLLYYEPSTNTLRLINDGGTDWMPAVLGSGGTLANSQCSIALGGTSATPAGNSLTLTLPVTFSGTFAGTKTAFMYAASVGGADSGWQTRGTWTVP